MVKVTKNFLQCMKVLEESPYSFGTETPTLPHSQAFQSPAFDHLWRMEGVSSENICFVRLQDKLVMIIRVLVSQAKPTFAAASCYTPYNAV